MMKTGRSLTDWQVAIFFSWFTGDIAILTGSSLICKLGPERGRFWVFGVSCRENQDFCHFGKEIEAYPNSRAPALFGKGALGADLVETEG